MILANAQILNILPGTGGGTITVADGFTLTLTDDEATISDAGSTDDAEANGQAPVTDDAPGTDAESRDWAQTHLSGVGWSIDKHVGEAHEQRSGPPKPRPGLTQDD